MDLNKATVEVGLCYFSVKLDGSIQVLSGLLEIVTEVIDLSEISVGLRQIRVLPKGIVKVAEGQGKVLLSKGLLSEDKVFIRCQRWAGRVRIPRRNSLEQAGSD